MELNIFTFLLKIDYWSKLVPHNKQYSVTVNIFSYMFIVIYVTSPKERSEDFIPASLLYSCHKKMCSLHFEVFHEV